MRRVKTAFLTVMAVYFAAPIVIVIGVSFNSRKSMTFPPEGFSLRWYGEALQKSDWLSAIETSFLLAALAAAGAVALALPLALYCWRRYGWTAHALRGLGLLPFMLPPVVSALGFLIFWSELGAYGKFAAAAFSHGVFLVTLPMVMISLGLEMVDRDLLDVARVCGANRRRIYTTVILPIIKPYLIFGFGFAFVLSFNEYIISFMLIGFTHETLPVKIYNSLRYGYTPVMAVVSTFFVAMTFGLLGLTARYGNLPRLFGSWEEDGK